MVSIPEIFERLKRAGVRQAEIARRTGIRQAKLSKWTNGRVAAGADDALKLLQLFEDVCGSSKPEPQAPLKYHGLPSALGAGQQGQRVGVNTPEQGRGNEASGVHASTVPVASAQVDGSEARALP